MAGDSIAECRFTATWAEGSEEGSQARPTDWGELTEEMERTRERGEEDRNHSQTPVAEAQPTAAKAPSWQRLCQRPCWQRHQCHRQSLAVLAALAALPRLPIRQWLRYTRRRRAGRRRASALRGGGGARRGRRLWAWGERKRARRILKNASEASPPSGDTSHVSASHLVPVPLGV